MYNKYFKNCHECKMIVLELENERAGKIETFETWQDILSCMDLLEKDMVIEQEAIDSLMFYVANKLLLPVNTYPIKWLSVKICEIRSMINYYKNNEEE